MNKRRVIRKTVFSTPWFAVQEAPSQGPMPNYSISAPDFACVVALTTDNALVLVEQYRHAVDEVTLELPAGHVDPGETPEQAARRELLEETGYTADHFEFYARLCPSTARFTNRMWCYFATGARQVSEHPQAEGTPVLWRGGIRELLHQPKLYGCGSLAALMMAVGRGKIPV